jgi:anti-anti-sigma factor
MEDLRIETVADAPEGVRILRLTGPFTMKTLFDFQPIVRSGDAPVTLIDLAGVPYVDSAALGCLMGVHVSFQRLNRKYALVGVTPRLMSLFSMVGVDNFVVMYPTVEAALKALTVISYSA